MKKIMTMVFLTLLGILNIQAQTGSINRTFYMDRLDGKIDTCYFSMNLENGTVTYAGLSFNHQEKGTYVLATISGNPNMYHRYKTVETRVNDFKSLLDSLYLKYEDWSKVAQTNKITNYKKKIGEYSNIPILFMTAFKKKIEYNQNTESPYIKNCTPYFEIDSKGNCSIFFGWNDVKFQRTKGYNAGFWTSYPIKETLTVPTIIFSFSSPSQIKSLIDALDIEKAKKELLSKSESNKNVDSLFK